MAVEYITNWDASWVDKLNHEVPKIMNDVVFEVHQSELSVPSQHGGYYKIPGQQFVKMVVFNNNEKKLFIETLKKGNNPLTNNFPNYMRQFIHDNLGYDVNRKYQA